MRLWNPNFHNRVYKSQALIYIQSGIRPIPFRFILTNYLSSLQIWSSLQVFQQHFIVHIFTSPMRAACPIKTMLIVPSTTLSAIRTTVHRVSTGRRTKNNKLQRMLKQTFMFLFMILQRHIPRKVLDNWCISKIQTGSLLNPSQNLFDINYRSKT